jgi:hypothetical protein
MLAYHERMMSLSRRWFRGLLVLGLPALLLSTSSCGSTSCEDACGAFADCPDQDSCVPECEDLVDMAEASGCESELDDALSCVADHGSECNAQSCAEPMYNFIACANGYCRSHPTSAGCGGSSSSCQGSASYSSGSDCGVDKQCDGTVYMMVCDGTTCTCSIDAVEQSSLADDGSICAAEHDARVDAATAACGWPE